MGIEESKRLEEFKRMLRNMGAQPKEEFFKEEIIAEMPVGCVWEEGWDGAEVIKVSLRKDGKIDIRVYLNMEGWRPISTMRGILLSRKELDVFLRMMANLSSRIKEIDAGCGQ